MNCRVCGTLLEEPAFSSGRKVALTSMCTQRNQDTVVFCCDRCGHLQTPPLDDLDSYYDDEYHVSTGTTEEDQLYKMVDGKPIYRTEFQAQTLLDKVDVARGARVLDFGAAKGMSSRHLVEKRPDVDAYVFDVTNRYVPYWSEFRDEAHMGTYELPSEWMASFDVIMSFYVLEHVDEPHMYARQAASLLKPGGVFYFIVPNVFNHTSDFVVVDHVNHFSEASLRYLMNTSGFEVVDIDADSHEGAWIVVARRSPVVEEAVNGADKLAQRWNAIYSRVESMSQAVGNHTCAIYGSSFWGTLIATNLDDLSNVRAFIDANPHYQGREYLGLPIVSPEGLDPVVTDILVGLEPLRARAIIESVEAFRGRNLTFHYLEADK